MGRAYRWEPQGVCTTPFARIAAATVRPGNARRARSGLCGAEREMTANNRIGGMSHEYTLAVAGANCQRPMQRSPRNSIQLQDGQRRRFREQRGGSLSYRLFGRRLP